MEGYCELHHQPWDIRCINRQWVCECPKCRAEGRYDTYVSTSATMYPPDRWTSSNSIKKIKNNYKQ